MINDWWLMIYIFKNKITKDTKHTIQYIHVYYRSWSGYWSFFKTSPNIKMPVSTLIAMTNFKSLPTTRTTNNRQKILIKWPLIPKRITEWPRTTSYFINKNMSKSKSPPMLYKLWFLKSLRAIYRMKLLANSKNLLRIYIYSLSMKQIFISSIKR